MRTFDVFGEWGLLRTVEADRVIVDRNGLTFFRVTSNPETGFTGREVVAYFVEDSFRYFVEVKHEDV